MHLRLSYEKLKESKTAKELQQAATTNTRENMLHVFTSNNNQSTADTLSINANATAESAMKDGGDFEKFISTYDMF